MRFIRFYRLCWKNEMAFLGLKERLRKPSILSQWNYDKMWGPFQWQEKWDHRADVMLMCRKTSLFVLSIRTRSEFVSCRILYIALSEVNRCLADCNCFVQNTWELPKFCIKILDFHSSNLSENTLAQCHIYHNLCGENCCFKSDFGSINLSYTGILYSLRMPQVKANVLQTSCWHV